MRCHPCRSGWISAAGGGNGLGLGIAQEIVALNGGRMDFALSSRNGLQVEIRLPLAA